MLTKSMLATLVAGLALGVVGSPVSSPSVRGKREIPATHRLHERHTNRLARSWVKRSMVPETEVLPMRIGLKQANLAAGRVKLEDM